MRHEEQEKLELVQKSLQGLTTLEDDENKQGKYIEFIEYYAKLSEQELGEFKRRYPQENSTMTSYYQQKLQEGVQAGIQQGLHQGLEQGLEQGQRLFLLQLMKKRFADELALIYEEKILSANLAEIEQWASNIFDAKTIDDIFA